MRLQQKTDFALRVLLVLAARADEFVPVPEIAATFGISHSHLLKVANQLVHLGLVVGARGRGGGLRLARSADTITVGEVVRAFEIDAPPLPCVRSAASECLVHDVCGLRGLLGRAEQSFLATLDGTSLSELAGPSTPLVRLLRADPRPARRGPARATGSRQRGARL